MQYLAAMVYYFIFAEADSKCNVRNKGVAALFKLSPSNLHKLVSGKKYYGGSYREDNKARSLEEPEEQGQKMVKVIKKKAPKASRSSASAAAGSSKSGGMAGKAKSKTKVTVTKMAVTPKLIDLPFLEDTPALGMRGAHKKKKEDDEPKK